MLNKLYIGLFFLVSLCSKTANAQFSHTDSVAAMHYIDSINLIYSQDDYEQMRTQILADSAYVKMMNDKVGNEDLTFMRLKVILETPHPLRFSRTGLPDVETNMLIFAIYKSQEIIESYYEVNARLPEKKSDSLAHYIDSVKHHMDSVIQVLRKDVVEHEE